MMSCHKKLSLNDLPIMNKTACTWLKTLKLKNNHLLNVILSMYGMDFESIKTDVP